MQKFQYCLPTLADGCLLRNIKYLYHLSALITLLTLYMLSYLILIVTHLKLCLNTAAHNLMSEN